LPGKTAPTGRHALILLLFFQCGQESQQPVPSSRPAPVRHGLTISVTCLANKKQKAKSHGFPWLFA
jgi:hypothetical protein